MNIHRDDQEKKHIYLSGRYICLPTMAFELCSAHKNFQRCMSALFLDLVGDGLEILIKIFLFLVLLSIHVQKN